MPTHEPVVREPLADILGRVAAELQDLARRAALLQDVAMPPDAPSFDTMVRAQDLDLVAQTLAGLSRFAETLACGLPRTWTADAHTASAAVTLSDLKTRLTGGTAVPERHQGDALELF